MEVNIFTPLDNFGSLYKIGWDEKNLFNINYSPTGNCQFFSFVCFNAFLYRYAMNFSSLSREKIGSAIFEDFTENDYNTMKLFLHNLSTRMNKRAMLIDVKEYYVSVVEKLFENCIINKMKYTSTNNSEMVIYIIKLN